MTNTLEADLRAALGRACQAQNAAVITQGRREILALPRDFVLQNIERIAADALPLEDGWEFRRLLEVYDQLDGGLLLQLAATGLSSQQSGSQGSSRRFPRATVK